MVSNRESASFVLYGDFSCARCYLASQRIDELARVWVPVSWRAVEAEPMLAVTGRREDADALGAVERSLAALRPDLRPGETLPDHAVSLLPKTQAAVSAYAEAGAAGVADEIRRTLFTAYWVHGANIGNPELLRSLLAATFMRGHATSDPIREFGYAVAMTREPITGVAWRLIRDWRREWEELGRDELPVLTSGSRLETGQGALRWLAELLDRQAAAGVLPADRDHGDLVAAGWRPPTTVTPPATWTSSVGDPWSRAGRMAL